MTVGGGGRGGGGSAVVNRVAEIGRERGIHILLGMRSRGRAWGRWRMSRICGALLASLCFEDV